MKITLFVSLLVLSACAYSGPVMVFGTTLVIGDACEIEAMYKNGETALIKLGLPKSQSCRFITHAETNLIHVERIKNSYVILVESESGKKDTCISKYTAIMVKRDGEVLPAEKIKTSGSCNIGRERKVFEYFSHKMNLE